MTVKVVSQSTIPYTGAMERTRWLEPREHAAWRAYVDSMRLLLQALDHQLQRDSGLSLTDYELLVKLSEAPDRRLRMSELALATLSTRSGATRAVTRLEQQELVRRVQCAGDRRGTFAELTGAGQATLERAAPGHATAVRQNMFDLLEADQVEALFGVADRVRRHLAQESAEPMRAAAAEPDTD